MICDVIIGNINEYCIVKFETKQLNLVKNILIPTKMHLRVSYAQCNIIKCVLIACNAITCDI